MNGITEKLKKEYKDKKVLVVGLGLQGGGVGLAKFFCNLGAKVTVTDKKSKDVLQLSLDQLKNFAVNFTLGTHKIDDFLNVDVIFKGPSVRWDIPELVQAAKKRIPIEMEMSFFAAYCPTKIIGVTGTRGKSTTTMMIYEILKNSGLKVHLAGNLPNLSTINLLPSITPDDWIVMELASWPLSGFHRKKISPHIGAFTNFYPDHLNYYQSMDDYFFDKKAIYLYQKPEDHLVVNQSLKELIFHDTIISKVHFFTSGSLQKQILHLKGVHNIENAACAIEVAKILGLDLDKAHNVLTNFKGLPYRQQIIAEKNGIIFINDTTSTTPVATVKAIDTFSSNPIVLILGGTSKNLPYDSLINRLDQRSFNEVGLMNVKKIVLLKGSFTDQILPTLKETHVDGISTIFDDLGEAVKMSYEFAKEIQKKNGHEKVLILFSPGAPSFAMFNNEFHRGEEFDRAVKKLTTEK